ncbi:Tfp pilus assembly protein FimT/FimU [Limnohabitans sp. JirII-31]|uniref:pilus assembly FimT family protein n=1 Tax=Limnohabitans sp. JirII-31 TaxID=1977908 RepID=UPI000C1E5842|nr:prepilin-type N-terminal cleavage/methylation domain-containing protein [Limnohabitans sp. JirII-31]PIT80634.1 hypothetical protein B9Z41_01560 [Limnohabitans sp. JirII-31]
MRGFSLLELVFVVVILGILSVYAIPKGFNITDVTLDSQAQKLASDLRHAQLLAATQGVSLCVLTSTNAYSVRPNSINCTADPITDPASGSAFLVNLEKGAELSGPLANAALVYNSLGQPNGEVVYTLNSPDSNNKKFVTVWALTGHVVVGP